MDGEKTTPVRALRGATVNLLGEPKLENRNWTLTQAGFEPIVPFNLEIQKGDKFRIFRKAPLMPKKRDEQIWKMPQDVLQAHGAVGLLYEPATVGTATGIWDSLRVAKDRLEKLTDDLKSARRTPDEIVVIEARMKELEIATKDPTDRRIAARYYVERFNFDMQGTAEIAGERGALGGIIDKVSAWQIGFWIGAWDPDALSAYILGALKIPYATGRKR
jgi:hypothetical protein